MADISMCANKTCPLRHQCYRYMAKENPYRQAYFIDLNVNNSTECPEYWPIGETGIHNNLDYRTSLDQTKYQI